MKRLANLLMAVGAIVAIIAFNMDVTGGGRFVNLGLIAERQNLLMLGCVAFLAGIVLLVGVQRQGEAKDSESDKPPKVPTVPLQLDLSVPFKLLLQGKSPAEFIGRLIGSAVASAVGAFVIDKIMDTMWYIDIISNAFHMDVWMNHERVYLPAAILIFLFAMKRGLSAITGMFYFELGACLVWSAILITFFDGEWAVFDIFAAEILYSIAGVVVATKFKTKAVPAIQ